MKLIYTFSSQFTPFIYKTKNVDKILTAYINYYIESIKSALNLGYTIDFYVSRELIYNFRGLKINLLTVDSINSGLFDFLKAEVLKNRSDQIMLVDGDIQFHKQIPLSDHDLIYDFKCITAEGDKYDDIRKDKTWNVFYKPFVSNLTKLGIKSIIPEWTGERLDFIHNIGVLYFNNIDLKNIYVDRWYKFNDFINKHINDKTPYTAVGAQYLLSEIINHHKFSSIEVEEGCYTHNLGIDKFKHPTVSTHEVQKEVRKSFL